MRPADLGGSHELVVAGLALATGVPDSLHVVLPCDEPGAEFMSLNRSVWETSEISPSAISSPIQYTLLGEGVRVAVSAEEILVEVGPDRVFAVPAELAPGCLVDVTYEDGLWSLVNGNRSWSTAGAGPTVVAAEFAGPATSNPISQVVVTTRELGSSPTGLQLAFMFFAIVGLVMTLRWVAAAGRPGLPRSSRRIRSRIWSMFSGLGPVDAAVLTALLIWMVTIPWAFDDGWIRGMTDGYSEHGAFSTIFEHPVTVGPLGYWVRWLGTIWFGISGATVFLRVPVLVVGWATWFGIRWIARRLGVPGNNGSVWFMAAVYTLGFGAWGMTLRAEPFVAGLAVASLALAIWFSDRSHGSIVAAWIVVVALGVTAHPAGVIVLAPVIVSGRALWSWAAANRHVAIAAVLSLATLTMLLFFVDTDLAGKLESIAALRGGTHEFFVFDELVRYEFLSRAPYGTLLRRLQVLLGFVGLLAFFLGSRKTDTTRSRLPSWSLVAALLLLFLTPSKWPWHFGGLIGLTALVVPLELRRVGRGRRRFSISAIVIALSVVVVMAWAWASDEPWAAFDLRTQQWWAGATNLFPFDLASVITWLGVAVGIALVLEWRARKTRRSDRRLLEVLVASGVALAMVITASTFVVDAFRTDGWTQTSQRLDQIRGVSECGLGEQVLAPIGGSIHVLPSVAAATAPADLEAGDAGFSGGGLFTATGYPEIGINAVLPVNDMGVMGSWIAPDGAAPESNVGSFRSDWRSLDPADDGVALMVMGGFPPVPGESVPVSEGTASNRVAVQWGSSSVSGVESMGIDEASPGGYFTDWSLVTLTVPLGADRVRLLLSDETTSSPDGWIASSFPLGVTMAPLSDSNALGTSTGIMITPPLALYFPCVDLPTIFAGVVLPPSLLMLRDETPWQTTFAAAAISDRYFQIDVVVPPNRDVDRVLLFVSQRFLTGSPARVNTQFDGFSG